MMWIFTKDSVLSSMLIKLIFITFFPSQLFANYIVVQRWIVPRDIIKEVPLRTVTSCVMECSRTNKCSAVGFQKDPDLMKNNKCLLVKLLRKKNKNGTRIKVFALVDEYTVLKDEQNAKISSTKTQTCPSDVNGGYNNWSNFTICSKNCVSCVQYRNRSCNNPTPVGGGRNCSILGNATEMRSCPINGGFGQWTSYGTCSKTCGAGEQQRNRSCDTPTPQHGGKNCTSLGSSTEIRSCNTNPCPVNGGYGQWTIYGICSVTCGIGQQQRNRSCDTPTPMHGGKDCTLLGNSKEIRSCNESPCIGRLQLTNASQSSLHSTLYPASKALDGELLFVYGDKHKDRAGCALTFNEQDAWWRAELLKPSFITKIDIVPRRQDTWQSRHYTRVTVLTSVDGIKWELCADLGDKMSKITTGWIGARCPIGTYGKFIKLVQHINAQFAVCEVKVFGYTAVKKCDNEELGPMRWNSINQDNRYAVTVGDCIKKCEGDNLCKGVSYWPDSKDPANGGCHFASPGAILTNGISWKSFTCTDTALVKKCDNEELGQMRWNKINQDNRYEVTVENCIKKCEEDNLCKGVSYWPDSKGPAKGGCHFASPGAILTKQNIDWKSFKCANIV